jgi:hypothetical protein
MSEAKHHHAPPRLIGEAIISSHDSDRHRVASARSCVGTPLVSTRPLDAPLDFSRLIPLAQRFVKKKMSFFVTGQLWEGVGKEAASHSGGLFVRTRGAHWP